MPAGPRLNEALGDASGRPCHTWSTTAQYLSASSERAGDDLLLYLDPGPWNPGAVTSLTSAPVFPHFADSPFQID